MHVHVEELSPVEKKVAIQVDWPQVAKKLDDAYRELGKGVNLKGFRKGKVPLAMLKKTFGARVLGDAMQDAIDGAMKGHFDASGDRPAMQPKVEMKGGESWKEGQDVVVEMTYEALPAIPEVDVSKVKIEKLVVKAADKDVAEALENLSKSAQNFEDRKKGSKAKDGDQVVVRVYKGLWCNDISLTRQSTVDTDASFGEGKTHEN